MQELKARFKKLENALSVLIAEHQLLRKEKQEMKAEIIRLKADGEGKSEELQKLKTELNAAKLAQGLQSAGAETDLTKAKLGSLMREIDKCIAALNE